MKKCFPDDIVKVVKLKGSISCSYDNICFDSREVKDGTLFVALKGTQTDGHDYIDTALSQGATIVVCEQMPTNIRADVLYVEVLDSYDALAVLSSSFYGNPSSRLKLIGVTGTNGKTTTVTLLHTLFEQMGISSGLLSTVVNKVSAEEFATTHTTPNPLELNRLLSLMVERGCEYCFMEVSSHAMVQKRTATLEFTGGIFTNLTHDHLDYHKTFAEYLKVKKSFFDGLSNGAFALTNIDDKNGLVMLQNCKAKKVCYSRRALADYRCKIKESYLDCMELELDGNVSLWVQFVGGFNAYNLLSVYGVAMECGLDRTEVLRVMSTLKPVCGRFETLRSSDGILGIIDYAHTPDALDNALSTISSFKGAGKVITVVGCGGDRDATKRPIMAVISANNSTKTILTSDNPRTESARVILDDMLSGLDLVQRRSVLVIEDRGEAIRTAVALSVRGDIILVAGKGHETYQEIDGVRHHFDDMEILRDAFGE